MTLDELLDKACTAVGLPSMARDQLPSALSDKTKGKLLKLSPGEVGRMLNEVIEAVNQGSVKSIDALVREQVKQ